MGLFQQFSNLSDLFRKNKSSPATTSPIKPSQNQLPDHKKGQIAVTMVNSRRHPIGVTKLHGKPVLFSQLAGERAIQVAIGSNHVSFQTERSIWKIPAELTALPIHRMQVVTQNQSQTVFLQYLAAATIPTSAKWMTYVAQLDQHALRHPQLVSDVTAPTVVLSDYQHHGVTFAFTGDRAIRLAQSTDLQNWQIAAEPLFSDPMPTQAGGAVLTSEGILLLYYKTQMHQGRTMFTAHLALLDHLNPARVLWNLQEPIWEQRLEWQERHIQPVGTIFEDQHFVSYWWVDQKMVVAIRHTGFVIDAKQITIHKKILLEKHAANPLIAPNQNHSWEAFTTFNPSAVYLDGKVHILYRAQGYDYVSSIGYAISHDGMMIHQRFDQPIYEPTRGFETNHTGTVNPHLMSGGGYGGCEDPRLTVIDQTVFMVYVAFDGWSPPRLAMTSLSVENFLKQRWLWSKPVLISPPGMVDKSGCLFPEKINGKYVFLHRVFPNILIDYVDDLNFDGKTNWLVGHDKISIRPKMWDSRKIGAGAPPLKTKEGWLLIYYGVDDKDAGKYHIGAMLLDLENPAKVLYRSNQPILKPETEYEWRGFKPGVAYPCGAVILDGRLLVYYGAADQVVCVATTDLDTFLSDLKTQTTIHWESYPIREG